MKDKRIQPRSIFPNLLEYLYKTDVGNLPANCLIIVCFKCFRSIKLSYIFKIVTPVKGECLRKFVGGI